MRISVVICALCLFLLPAAAQEAPLASKFPAGATAYVEIAGLANKLEALEDSALGKSIANHPLVKMLGGTPNAMKLSGGVKMVEVWTGMTRRQIVRAFLGDRVGIAMYGKPRSVLAAVRVAKDTAEQFIVGIELVPTLKRKEVMPAGDNAPTVFSLGPVFFFHDGTYLFVSPDQMLIASVRSKAADGLASDAHFQQARNAAGADATLFGYVDGKLFRQALAGYDKPKEIGSAIVLGAFAHYVPKAPWAAFRLDLSSAGETWTLTGEGFVPVPEKTSEPVAASYRGTLEPLPFALPERTVGIIRMRRSLASVWSNRDALIAPKGIPGLIAFETNFGNLAAGMSWVEEVLPNFGDELILLGTRRIFEEGKPAPAIHFPQGALLLPLKNTKELGNKLQIAFNNVIAIINLQQGMMGSSFLAVATDYKGVRILQAEYMTATKGEMEGQKNLPPRFNLSPACATVGKYFVIASNGEIVRRLVDNYGKPGPAPEGVNAGIWLKPDVIRALLEENREPLIAGAMVEDGIPRAEAEGRIKLLIDLARYIKSFEITARESRATIGVRFDIAVEAPQ